MLSLWRHIMLVQIKTSLSSTFARVDEMKIQEALASGRFIKLGEYEEDSETVIVLQKVEG